MRLLSRLWLGEVRVSVTMLERRARGTAFLEQPARTVLNPPESTGMPFWSVNPYLGCEFGCRYCYARFAHRYAVDRAEQGGALPGEAPRADPARPWERFEHLILVKRRRDVTDALERDLRRLRRRVAASGAQTISIGTATDPYQPAERRFRITRAVLERLAAERGLRLSIVTKSALVRRDLDVLQTLSARHDVAVCVSLMTVSPRLVRLFEPRSPLPHVRLGALHALSAGGVRAGIMCAPVLPGITDRSPAVHRLFAAAREAGGRFVTWAPLRLAREVKDPFLPIVAAHFPRLLPRYRAAYARATDAPPEYREGLRRRLHAAARSVGLPTHPFSGDAPFHAPPQLAFW